MKYFIFSNKNDVSQNISTKIIDALKNNANFEYDKDNPQVVISIGGDGRMLKCIREYMDRLNTVSFIGISTGKLGFLCDYKSDEIDEFIKSFISSTPHYDARRLIKLTMNDYEDYFVNEARVERVFKTLECDVYINNIFLEKFRGNGLNFSSPTGSSAYNRSLGGPVVHPTIPCYIMGEVASINHNVYRSLHTFLTLRDFDKVTLKGDFSNTYIGGDNIHKLIDKKDDEIKIELSKKCVIFAHYRGFNYYNKLTNSFVLKEDE